MDIMVMYNICSDSKYTENMIARYRRAFTIPSNGIYYMSTPAKYQIVTERLIP